MTVEPQGLKFIRFHGQYKIKNSGRKETYRQEKKENRPEEGTDVEIATT